MACASWRRLLLLAPALVSVAWCKCQYSRWPNAPDTKHFSRVCTSDAFRLYNQKSLPPVRRCEVEVSLPPGKTLTVGTCEATCSKDKACVSFAIRTPWLQEGKRGNCWLLYEKNLKRTPPSITSRLAGSSKNTFVKEFCDCEARYVHVERQSRIELNFLKDQIQRRQKDLAEKLEQIRTQNKTLEEKRTRHAELVKEKGNEGKAGGWWRGLPRFGGDRPENLEREIRSLEQEIEETANFHRLDKEEVAGWERALQRERLRLEPRKVLEDTSGIYQWFPPEPEHQNQMKLSRIQFGNIFLSDDKHKILYQCDKNSERKTGSNWYIVTLEQILKHLKLKEVGDIKSMGAWSQLMLYLSMDCLGYRVQDVTGGSAQICDSSDGKGNACLPVKTLSTLDPNVGCHKTAPTASKYRELLVVKHMQCDISDADIAGSASDEADGADDAGDGGASAAGGAKESMGCPIAHDEASRQVMGLADWVAKHPWQLRMALEGIKIYSYSNKDITWGEASAAYVSERLNVILKHFVPVIAAISAIDHAEDEWVKIACSALMLKNIQKMQGIFPKLAQNLAMRPDMIRDDYTREKLKETQSENPQYGRAFVEEFVTRMGTTVEVFSAKHGKMLTVPIFEAIRYKKLLAAGSVGQVLLYEVTSDDLKKHLRLRGKISQDGHVILKVVFAETENNYKSDWTMLEVLFGLATKFYNLGPVSSFWKFLKPMRDSIFNEFDLHIENQHTSRGREALHEFTELASRGKIRNLNGVKFTAPFTVKTSSKYALIQSMAQGIELKDYMVEAVGLPSRLTTWREKIYRGILHLYGFMAMRKGFFQADPHGGNWFVDEKKDIVVTLIDWGGVEQFTVENHCKLAEFYYLARAETNRLEDCSSLDIKTARNGGKNLWRWKNGIRGRYEPAGVSVFSASPELNLPNLILGFSAAYKYRRVGGAGKPSILRFDGEAWRLSEMRTGASGALLTDILEHKASKTGATNLRDPVSANPSSAGWVKVPEGSPTGSLEIRRKKDRKCQPQHVLANDKANTEYIVDVFSRLGRDLGMDPAPERTILKSALAASAAAFGSDAALLARIGMDVYMRTRGGDVLPRIAPEWVLLLRCLAVFSGMLMDVLKQNIPPKLPQEYLESFLDPSSDSLFKYWAGYAEAGNVLDGKGKCILANSSQAPCRSCWL